MTNASYRIVNRYLNQLFDASFDKSWAAGDRAGFAKAPRAPIDFRVRKSLRLLDDGLAQGIELDSVARDAGLSRPHFYKLFRENIGITPALYANTMRVERALDRLTGSQDSVTDIGFELGFSSQSHFTHFFAAQCRHCAHPVSDHRAGSERIATPELVRGAQKSDCQTRLATSARLVSAGVRSEIRGDDFQR